MSYTAAAWNVPANATVPVFYIPPMANVTFYNLGSQAVYLGTSAAVSAADGLQCHSLPTSFYTYVGFKGTQVYATTGSATAGTFMCLIVTNA